MTEAIYFDRQGNYTLVGLTDRKFPGLLIQGDSIKSLQETVDELSALSTHGDGGDIKDTIQEVHEIVNSMPSSYEAMMQEHGLKLPFATSD